jgi:hypothetical protein
MLNDLNGLLFRDSPLIINLFLKSWSIAVFQDEDLKIIIPENVIALHKIGAIELIHKAWLRFAQALLDGSNSVTSFCVNGAKVHELDGNLFLGFIVHSLVNLPIRSFSNLIVDDVFVNY